MRARAQRGLTLIELLLGLAIAAVLAMPLAAMFQGASSSAVTTRAALDLNADARFALDRIVQTAAVPARISSGTPVTDSGAAAWLAPFGYAVVKGNLVETNGARTSIIAANVTAFRLSAPEVGDGQPILKIELTLQAQGNSVSASRSVRAGTAF